MTNKIFNTGQPNTKKLEIAAKNIVHSYLQYICLQQKCFTVV